MPLPLASAWSSRQVELHSPATARVVANRLRVQLEGPLNKPATREGLFGEVTESRVVLAWLMPMELSLFRPQLRARLLEDEQGTRLVGRFALSRALRFGLGVVCVGVAFALWTILVGLFSGPGPELVFLLLIFVAAALLVKVAAAYATERFGELCDHLADHLKLVIADPPRSGQPRKHVRLEVQKPGDEPLSSDANRTA